MYKGTIKFFNETSKYGFIVDSETGKDVFFHVTGVKDREVDRNSKDKTCSYDLFDGKNGPEANNVVIN
jgi:CspA family cold shock protein